MTSEVRYFRSKVDGGVTTGDYLEANPNYTEVQVVPLDAIVIRRDELPEVETHETAHGDTVWVYGGDAFDRDADNRTAEAMRDGALRLLARAEYVREHPPVDEEQVDALRDILLSTRNPADGRPIEEQYRDVARRLVERGVRVEAS